MAAKIKDMGIYHSLLNTVLPEICHCNQQVFINKGSSVSTLLQRNLADSSGKLDSCKIQTMQKRPKIFFKTRILNFLKNT